MKLRRNRKLPYRAWTDGETARLREAYATTPAEALARELNRTEDAIFKMAGNLGLSRLDFIDPSRCGTPRCRRKVDWHYGKLWMCDVCFERWFEQADGRIDLQKLERLDNEIGEFAPSTVTTVNYFSEETI
jgi:hypothetical protein